MTNPTQPFIITIKANTSTNKGEKVKVTNLTRGKTIVGTLDASKSTTINAKDEGATNWVAGDTVQAEIHGRLQGYASGTLTAKGVKLTMDDTADTDTPAINM